MWKLGEKKRGNSIRLKLVVKPPWLTIRQAYFLFTKSAFMSELDAWLAYTLV